MTVLANGKYKTAAGSTLVVSGKHSGIFTVEFDWFEEGACVDCAVNTRPDYDEESWWLTWDCDECGGGRAQLIEVEIVG